MNDTRWNKVSIYTTPDGIEPVYGMLLSMGIEGAEIVDEGDFLNFLENNKQYWDYVDDEVINAKKCPTHLNIFLRDDESGHELLLLVKENLKALKEQEEGLGSLETELAEVDELEWYENWKKYFKPLDIGDNIIIIPQWEDTDAKGRIPLRINPGMLFGTGSHNTTRLCIELLEKLVKKDMSVFDIGCGSGILSILSLLLGAKRASAVDIDTAAVKIAYENAAFNGIGKDNYFVTSGNILENDVVSDKFDIVIANIVADVIIPLSAKVRNYMNEGAVFICSGIINDRVSEVLEALIKNGFNIKEKRRDGEWWAIVSE